MSAYDVTSYYWALVGRINPADMALSQVFQLDGAFSELWPKVRAGLAKLRNISIESTIYPDFEAVPQTCMLSMLNDSDESYVFSRTDQLVNLLTLLQTATHHAAVEGFLSYFDQEIREVLSSGVDISVEQFLWSELVLALPELSRPSFEAILESVNAVVSGEMKFEWAAPPLVPWVIEEDRLQRSMVCFKPWPWTTNSLSVFGDDVDTDGYVITRLKRTSEQDAHVSQVQKVLAFWALYEAIGNKQFDLSGEDKLVDFFSSHEQLLEQCADLVGDDWEDGFAAQSELAQRLEVEPLDERSDDAWQQFCSIIRAPLS